MTWAAPDDGGSPITGYYISIRQSDQVTFTIDQANCDMSVSTLTQCIIPVMTLREPPYNLEWGTHVFAKVIARNLYGDSVASFAGNGAKITTTPDSPTNLAEVLP